MHLSSITLKGFKSFPDRTRLTFSPGVSVIVGPNGSGKSNITDAVLWALGEQSPVAVRGAVDAGRDLRGRATACRRARRPRSRSCSTTRPAALDLPVGEVAIVAPAEPRGGGRVPHQRRHAAGSRT